MKYLVGLLAMTCTTQPAPGPAPAPVTTIPTVVVTPAQDAGRMTCDDACAKAQTLCAKPAATVQQCVADCKAGVKNISSPNAECIARVVTCNLPCS
jgi:hypothetical protein